MKFLTQSFILFLFNLCICFIIMYAFCSILLGDINIIDDFYQLPIKDANNTDRLQFIYWIFALSFTSTLVCIVMNYLNTNKIK